MERQVPLKLRDVRVAKQQKEVMVSFMEKHIEFARGQFAGPEGRLRNQKLWQELVILLNKYVPQKDLEKWQRVWSDLKMATKKKASAINKWRSQTGGGPPTTKELSQLEERIVNLISKDAVYGISGPEGIPLDSAAPVADEETTELAEPTAGPSREPQLIAGPSWEPQLIDGPSWEPEFDSSSSTISSRPTTPITSPTPTPSTSTATDTHYSPRHRRPITIQTAEEFKKLAEENNKKMDKALICLENISNNISIMNNNFVTSQTAIGAILERIAVALENKK